ncbi:MAG: cardiolipin synthase [Ruminococcus sp.]|nr:cardiolipin synthase [Ruminococcus sp.]
MNNQENDIIKLLPKRKKGILRIVFSRLFVFLLLIVIQFILTIMVLTWLDQHYKAVVMFEGILKITMIFYLFNCNMDSSAKLSWLLIIAVFSVTGSMLLWYTRREFGNNIVRKKSAEFVKTTRGMISSSEEAFADPDVTRSGMDDLCRYLSRTGCYPLFNGTDVTYFSCGEEKFESLLNELRKAKKFIFMEYFILDEGYMWGSVLKILADKVKEGVEVRVMYDGMCEITTLSHDYPQRMKKLGINCKSFMPLKPVFSTYYNYRDHRKILVIDGNVAFNGGINLADEYINRTERFGHWKDAAVMVKGKAVSSYTLMFLNMWNITEKEPVWDYLPKPVIPEKHSGYVMPYADCPLDDDKVGENIYMDILNRATTYVHIMTPYLILDGELESALKFAAERGVDIKIILPGKPDKPSAYALAKTHYKALTKAGVQIFEYEPGFVHSKVFVCDNEKAVVGTINLDYRSLYHHFECATYMYKTDCISDIEKDFLTTLKMCRPVTMESIRRNRFTYALRGNLLKLIAPLM